VDGINKFIYELIAERRRQNRQPGWTKPNDILEILLSVEDETDGTGMSDLQIRDELMSLLFAGHDTSAAALSWLLYLVALHPEVEAKILAEAESLKDAGATALPRLPYTEMVVKEVLRLYPSGWVTTRQTVEEWKVGPYLIPAGSDVWLSPWVTQRDPRYFAQPQAFWPERWEGGKLERELPRLAYSPFGGGPHQCIGQPLAMLEISLIAASLLKEYHLELVTEPPSLKPGPSLSLDPPRNLKLLLQQRQ
jgi:cytochrome P450